MSKRKTVELDPPYLDDEEREMLEGLNDAVPVEDKSRAEAVEEWRAIARNTLRKKAITVRIQESDIAKLKSRALQKGLPYQTLIASILHQYAEGQLLEKP